MHLKTCVLTTKITRGLVMRAAGDQPLPVTVPLKGRALAPAPQKGSHEVWAGAGPDLPAQRPFHDPTAPLSSAEGRKEVGESDTLGGNKVSISIIQLILDPHYHG